MNTILKKRLNESQCNDITCYAKISADVINEGFMQDMRNQGIHDELVKNAKSKAYNDHLNDPKNKQKGFKGFFKRRVGAYRASQSAGIDLENKHLNDMMKKNKSK